MNSTPEPIILSSDVVASLPLYYRCAAQYLAEIGRAVIKDSEKPTA